MPAKYRKSSKRRFAPKRRTYMSRKRSSYRKKFTKPDGMHNEKIIYQQGLISRNNQCSFFFTWLKALPNAGAYGISQSVAAYGNADQQFVQCANMYREYRVTGVRLDYTPSLLDSAVGVSAINVASIPITADENG